MRITNSMLVTNFIRDLSNNLGEMKKSQEQLSSGKKLNRPSDDPIGLIDSLRLRTDLTELEQFRNNAESALSNLEATDDALNEAGGILQRIRELAVQGANGTLDQDALDAIASEIDELKKHLINIGNSNLGGKYIFSGTETLTPAFDANGVYQGNANNIEYEIGEKINIAVNVNGAQAFGNAFTVLDGLINDLQTGNRQNISDVRLSQIDSIFDQHLQVRADVGARVNRVELENNRMDSLNVNLTELLSKAEDANVAQVITQLKMQENVYRASLSVGARIIQPTLVDFLR